MQEVFTAARDKRFVWGQHDCCLFACDCVAAMTGADPAANFRGRYKTKRGAYGSLKRFAGGGVRETWEKLAGELGMAETPLLLAQRGDVVLLETDLGESLGIVDFSGQMVAFVDLDGLRAVAISAIAEAGARAWRV